MGELSALGELLRNSAWNCGGESRTSFHEPGLLSVWHTRQKVSKRAYPYLSWVWHCARQRSQCRAGHTGKGFRTYRGAHGNRRAGLVKRFWTDCLYSPIYTDGEQAGWLKEEPSAFDAAECQNSGSLVLRII